MRKIVLFTLDKFKNENNIKRFEDQFYSLGNLDAIVYNTMPKLHIYIYILSIYKQTHYCSPFYSKLVARNRASTGSHYVVLNCLYTTVRPCTKVATAED